MSGDRSRRAACRLCGGNLGSAVHEGDDGGQFCSPGCRDVAAALPDASGGRPDEGTAAEAAARRDDLKTVFFHVDGMHSATCETFVERRATSTDGVRAAEASYVTETVRIAYDPRRTSPEALRERLTTLGYTALDRADVPVDADALVEPTADGRTDRERVARERSLDDLLGYRYAAAVLFASFLLLPYVVMVYPSHLGELLGVEALANFGRNVGFGSADGIYLLPFFLTMTGVVLLFAGMPLLRGAYVSLRVRRPNTELLVTATVLVALTYSTIAVLRGRTDVFFDATVVVVAAVVAATFYEALGKREAMARLTDLTVSRVREATRYGPDGTTWTEPVEGLEPGDRLLVRQGERVPVDGTLVEGPCAVDEAVVTGESLPVTKREGDQLVGGSVVVEGAAVLRVTDAVTSSLDRLTAAVWDVQSAGHGVKRRADRLAGLALPAVLAAGAVVGLGVLALGETVIGAGLAALATVLVATPWAIGLATPLSVATNVRAALARGIVVFDETIFERLRDVDVVVFDKTGTLTTGEMAVRDADAPADLLAAAGALEQRAAHPAAAAIARAFGPRRNADGAATAADGGDVAADEAPDHRVESFETHATGVEGVVDGGTVLVGAPSLFAEQGWDVPVKLRERAAAARGEGQLPVLVGRDGAAAGVIVVGDEARPGWRETVSDLAEDGRRVVVLTGDDEAAAAPFAAHSSVEHVFAGIPPAGKTAAVRRLQAEGRVAMVGDGTNDAPALAAADLGVSLGGGTALAADAADVTLVEDDLAAVGTAFDLAGAAVDRTRRTLRLSLAYNAVAVPAALAGLLNPVTVMGGVVLAGGLVGANAFRSLLDA